MLHSCNVHFVPVRVNYYRCIACFRCCFCFPQMNVSIASVACVPARHKSWLSRDGIESDHYTLVDLILDRKWKDRLGEHHAPSALPNKGFSLGLLAYKNQNPAHKIAHSRRQSTYYWPPPQLVGLAASRKFCTTSSGRKLLIYLSLFDWDPYKQCLQRSIQAHVPTRAIERAGVVEKATS